MSERTPGPKAMESDGTEGKILKFPVVTGMAGIEGSIQDAEMSAVRKWSLYGQYANALFRLRREQIDTALRVEKARLVAAEDLARKAIEEEHFRIGLMLQRKLQELMENTGIDVSIHQARVLQTFSERIVQFEEDLATSTAKPEHKEMIIGRLDQAFKMFDDKLKRFARDIFGADEGL